MPILPATTSDLVLEHLDAADACITMMLRTTCPTASCPRCGAAATRVQSRYTRVLADLPWSGTPVRILLQIRRFWCDLAPCPRRIFAERLPDLARPHARRTVRLTDVLTQVAFALGGEAGARLLVPLGMATSPDSLLRLIRQTPVVPLHHPHVLGVDDFALRRGCTYGTVLVDLDAHQPVDLLPDRTASSLAQWLTPRPGVRIITRDRSTIYADGALQGAPSAIQVADRWHLLKNVGDALERVLARHPDALRAAMPPAAPTALPPVVTAVLPQPHLERRRRQSPPVRRHAQYTQVHALHQQGRSISAISQTVGLTRPTVRKYLRAPSFPARATRYRHLTAFNAYEAYVRRRWAEGCHNAALLWRELQAQGFTGSPGTVRRYVGAWRPEPPHERPPTSTPTQRRTAPASRPPSLQRVRRWLLRAADERTAEQAAYVARLLADAPAIHTAATLTWEFNRVIRTRDRATLKTWLQQATTSGVPEFAACAASLQQDYAAVDAALRLPYSNGQTEGQVTRIKLVKRAMYGRAKFDLLRQRVLYRAP